jgi:hypothetical protein
MLNASANVRFQRIAVRKLPARQIYGFMVWREDGLRASARA